MTVRASPRVLHLSNLPKSSKRGIQRFCIRSLQFGQLGKWGSKLGKNAKLWTTLQTRSREQSHARGKRVRLKTFYFYPLPSSNANSLGDDLFLSFAFCYESLQIATNAKSICQSLWRCSDGLNCKMAFHKIQKNLTRCCAEDIAEAIMGEIGDIKLMMNHGTFRSVKGTNGGNFKVSS